MDVEVLRKSYKPDTIHILLIGESPPASGRFFYDKSLMTSYTASAFTKAYDIEYSDASSFLRFFKDKGCYLDDLSSMPIDNLPNHEREQVLEGCVKGFSKRLREYIPEIVVVVLNKITLYVESSMQLADLTCPLYSLPFPGHGHQRKYIDQLADILKEHLPKNN